MLLEEYPYINRTEDTDRIEDKFPYGFELYRAGVTGTYLVPLCIGSYGFIDELETEIEAIHRAHMFMLKNRKNHWCDSADKIFSVYAKIYKMDRNRDIIEESIKTIGPLYRGDIDVTDECLKNGTIETV